MEKEGSTYNIQNDVNAEGYFGIKVMPQGANLCLLEAEEEGEIKAIVS